MQDEIKPPEPPSQPALSIETELDHLAQYIELFKIRDREMMPE